VAVAFSYLLENASDEMSRLDITRRDFINGIAMSVAAGSTLSPLELLAQGPTAYPPSLTGMRGSHVGSFEVAHALAQDGARWPRPNSQTDDDYDLVVVGGGISGLAAAFLYRQQAGNAARILIIDNHDDFGGHAKRNEFSVGSKTLIGYGGSQSIQDPGRYSQAAKRLLVDAGIHTQRFYKYFDRDFYRDRGMSLGYYFPADSYGNDSVHPAALHPFGWEAIEDPASVVDKYPLSEAARESFRRLLSGPQDLLPDMPPDEKAELMQRISYSDYLRKHGEVHEDVITFLRDFPKGIWGSGYDTLSALEGARMGMPGTWDIDPRIDPTFHEAEEEPYIFHFPDGNAGVARGLIRQLIPDALPGDTMEDLVTSRADYAALDRRSGKARIRLNSTVVDVRNVKRGEAVDVVYVKDGQAQRVRARHAILACYNHVIPYICAETPATQVQAIETAEKVPLVYINIALRNWKAFANLGFNAFRIFQGEHMHSLTLDFPVSMGDYAFAESPEDPIIVHGTYCPTVPDQGLTQREQFVAGRAKLYTESFDQLETSVVRDLSGALGGGGFVAERDIAGITINRWPHGYAYEYNELYDPPEWNKDNGPHVLGAAQIGRISIANSDASAYAYVNGAIDAAMRAVDEQLKS